MSAAENRERELFEAALDQPVAERPEFLRQRCSDDPELLRRVERLLASEQRIDDEPERIGRYRILQRIGEGGMGVVYLAEQSEPVRRRVAIKLIKLGMDTKEVIARFEAERQAMALMDHPHIAKILDASATERGRPYFVMEYVSGRPITEVCDASRLGTAERLRLFVQVCGAVQHAHHRGVIHRDLKPSNILVTEVDGVPFPKVIDFGVAKAVSQRLTTQTLFTQIGRAIGTPQYMSPEQADPHTPDADTRSDVYSLGVVLYELLVGALPIELEGPVDLGFAELQRAIREDDPPPPSTRISRLGETATTRAHQRRTSVRELSRELRGELDWIVMKALAKEPARRYQSAAGLAEDVERHLAGEAVLAGRPSAVYRLRKSVRRHRIAIAFALTVLILSTALAVTSATQAHRIAREAERANLERDRANDERDRANDERDRANLAATEAREAQDEAKREAARARDEADLSSEVTQFLTELFRVRDVANANTITAREILDRGAAAVQEQLVDRPSVLAILCNKIGAVYMSLGQYEAAMPLLEKSVELLANQESVDPHRRAGHLFDLGMLETSRGRYEQAEAHLRRSLEEYERSPRSSVRELAGTLNSLGTLEVYRARYEVALDHHRAALAKLRTTYADDHAELAITYNNIAAALYYTGELEEAAEFYERALEIEQRDPENPTLCYVSMNLGGLYRALGDEEQAEDHLLEALAICDELLDPTHEVVGAVCEELGQLWMAQDPRPEETGDLLERGVDVRAEIYGRDHVVYGRSLSLWARYLVESDRPDEARAALDEALKVMRARYQDSHPNVLALLALDALLELGEDRSPDRFLDAALRSPIPLEGTDATQRATLARHLETAASLLEDRDEVDRATRLRTAIEPLRD